MESENILQTSSNLTSYIGSGLAAIPIAIILTSTPVVNADNINVEPLIKQSISDAFIDSETILIDSSSDSNRKLLIETIGSYRNLDFNWDGYNGTCASEEAVNNALTFISQITNIPDALEAGFSGDGEIGLFVRTDNIFIDIGFEGNKYYSFYAKDDNGNEFVGDDYLIEKGIDHAILSILNALLV